jgi:hypothetical protein
MEEADMADRLPDVHDLSELAELIGREPRLYVRWSQGPQADLADPASRDELTGVPLPGLSASPLAVEEWWGDRPLRLWAARRIYDYSHLRADKGPDVRPWLLVGREAGRGPDNEPLVCDARPVAWVDEKVIEQATDEITREDSAWGSLRRRDPGTGSGGPAEGRTGR